MISSPCTSVLIIRPGALGDAVLTLPVLRALRAAGTRRIVVLGNPANWRWLRAAENGVAVADWNGAEWLGLFSPDVELATPARRQLEGIERAIVYLRSGLDEAAARLRQCGIREVLSGLPPRWPEHPDDARDDRHAAQRLLAPLGERVGEGCRADLRGRNQADEPLLAVSNEERGAALQRLGFDAAPSEGFFAVHPGSGGASKCWPSGRYRELLRRAARQGTSVPLVFMGPVEETSLANGLRDLPEGTRLARSFPLREVLALLSLARVFVGNDAGVTHLAARCCPTLQLFGATRPCRWKALGPDVTAVQAPEGMLERLDVDSVWHVVERLLSAPP